MLHLDAGPGRGARVWALFARRLTESEVNHYMDLHVPRVDRKTTLQVLRT